MMIDLNLLKQIKCSDELINWFKVRTPAGKKFSLSELYSLLGSSGRHDFTIELKKQLLSCFFDRDDVIRNFTDLANTNIESGLGYCGPDYSGENKVRSKTQNAEIISREHKSDILSQGNYATIYSYGYNNGINIKGNYSFVAAYSISTVLNSGKRTMIELHGNDSEVFNSGYNASVDSSGVNSFIVSSGPFPVIRNSGRALTAVVSGYSSQIFNTGSHSILAVTNYSHVINSGDNTIIGCSGDSSVVFNYGKDSKISVTGSDSVVMCADSCSLIRLGKNNCAAIKCYDGNRVRIRVVYEGEDGIKPDTWYITDCSGDVHEATQEEINAMTTSS